MLTIDVVLVVAAMTISCLGNVLLTVSSLFTKSFHSLFVVNIAVFDVLSILLGSSVYLLTYSRGHTWLLENPSVCQAVGFMTSFASLASLIGWLTLAIYCRQIHRLDPKVKIFSVVVVSSWLVAIFFTSFGLAFGTYSFQGHPKKCSLTSWGYTYFVAVVTFCIQILSFVVSCFALKLHQRYHLTLQWQRHRRELQLNDPEKTTVQSSQSEISVTNTIESLLVALSNTKLHATSESLSPAKTLKSLMFTEVEKEGNVGSRGESQQQNTNIPLGMIQEYPEERRPSKDTSQSKAFIIPLKDESGVERAKKPLRFKSTFSLSETNRKIDSYNKQFLVMTVMVSGMSIIAWMPYYFIEFLNLSASASQTSLLVIYGLTYLKAILGPVMFLTFCRQYRRIITWLIYHIRKYLCFFYSHTKQRRNSMNLDEDSSSDILEGVVLKSLVRINQE